MLCLNFNPPTCCSISFIPRKLVNYLSSGVDHASISLCFFYVVVHMLLVQEEKE